MSEPIHIQNYIDGKFLEPVSGKWIDDICPATGEVLAKIPDSDKEDVELAVAAAKRAFPGWSKTPKETRARLLTTLADAIEKNVEDLALAESKDNGKPVALARTVDIPRAIYNFRFFASAILLHEDMSTHNEQTGAINYVISQPIGVAGLISPWNLPLYLLTWKIAPAISVGNTCVAKPSELTPLTAFLLCRIISEVGFPPGVINIVHGVGPRAGQAIVEHPEVPLISFTGGTVTGKKISETASHNLKRVSLELGGKNPHIVFDDCDFEKTIQTTLFASFQNQGEICLCCERIFVQEGIYDRFLKAFVEGTKDWKVGSPNEGSTKIGALISLQHLEKVKYYVQLARELGGKIECGGHEVKVPGHEGGFYYAPTIVTGLNNDCRFCQEEIFGPVVAVIPFKTEAEAIELANRIPFGLSSTVFTENLGRAQRVGLGIQAGTVWVNCWMNRDLRVPFGGAKMSGIGREGGKFSFDFFCEKKTICFKY